MVRESPLSTAVLIAGLTAAVLISLNVFLAQKGLAQAKERKRAEEAEQRFAAVLEATTDFVAIVSPSGKLRYMNRAARRIIGVAEDADVTESVFSDHIPKRMLDLVLNHAVPSALRYGVWSGETALIAANGAEVPVSQVILAHYGRDGNLNFISTIMRDIAGAKESEEKFRQMSDNIADVFSEEVAV